MKKFLFVASLLTVAVSCAKVEEPQAEDPIYSLSAEVAASKTSIEDSGSMMWQKGDVINVLALDGTLARTADLTLVGDEATVLGTFDGAVGFTPAVAVYPANEGHAMASATAVDVVLPSSYEWKAGDVKAPMLAQVTSTADPRQGTAKFKHMAGLIKVTYKNVPAAARSFTFTATTGIVGTFAGITISDPILNADENLGSVVAYTFSAPVAEEMSFYVPAPCGTYGFSVALCDENDQPITGTKKKIKSATVAKGQYYILPAITLSAGPSKEEYTFSSFTSAADVTINAENFTITLHKNTGTTNPAWNANSGEARVYAKGSLVISASRDIKKIEYEYAVNANSKGNAPTIDSVKGKDSDGTWDSAAKTWTGSDKEVTFSTSGTAGNIGFTKITVYFDLSDPTPEKEKYAVTIETPEHGSLVIKNGEQQIASGDSFIEGTVLTIVTTPDEGYRFKNWQAVDESTHTFTAKTEWTMGAHAVTFKANFEEIPSYTIKWYVNGTVAKTEILSEGASVTAPEVGSINGKSFIGWVTTSTVDASANPALVTPATATADANYYAVFATVEGSGEDAWKLVTDASSLAENDVIALVSSEKVDYNELGSATKHNGYIAMGVTQNTNTRAGVAVSVTDGVLAISDDVQQITLTSTTINGNTGWQLGVGENGYLYAASSSSNYLKSQKTNNVNGMWTITIAEGKATIYAQYSSNTRNYLRVNGNYQNSKTVAPVVSAYANTASVGVLASIYKFTRGASVSGYTTTP